jgi:phosphatidylserine decarboxylase
MKIHKEGYRIILFALLIIVSLLLLVNYTFPSITPIHYLLYLGSLVVFILIVRFFRSPVVSVEINENHILSPADGKIVAIEEVFESEYFHEKRKVISVFMSVNNVHVNRYPLSGIVIFKRYHPGAFWFAWRPKSSTENERTTVVVENKDGQQVLIRQIAGGVARRIVCYARENDNVRQGGELGFIKFGSRVDVFLPLTAQIDIDLNQIVWGAKTILGRFSP